MPVQIDAGGLQSALEELAAATNVPENVACRFVCSDPVVVANNTTASHLYRIAQEAVNNALRHGRASEIVISLLGNDDHVTLEVRDNGLGFDPASRRRLGPTEDGMGLRIMEYRAGIVGGVLHIERKQERGMLVRCSVPQLGLVYSD
jgi:two-component system CheB/CheR fusion protein